MSQAGVGVRVSVVRAATVAAVLLLACVSLARIVAVARIFAARLRYPMDLEWCEGGSLYMAWRLVHHLPIYVKPGDVFAPFPYPPGHTLAIALFSWFAGGVDYAPARAVSIVSFLLLCVTLALVVAREFRGRIEAMAAGIATVGYVACAFPATGGWYDLVRVDSMMLAFSVLAAALVSMPGMSAARMIGAAVAMTIAVYTKQTAAFFAAWICLYAIVRNWREGLKLSAIAFGFCAAALVAMLRATHGQAWFWIFRNLASHPIDTRELWTGLEVVARFAPFAAVLPLAFLVLAVVRRAGASTWLWFGMLLVALPATLLPYAKHGGWKNDMIPVIVLIAPVTLLLIADVVRLSKTWGPLVHAACAIALAAFVWNRPVDPGAFVPDAKLWAAANNLNALIGGLAGGVISPQMAFLPARNGHTNPNWHRMGHADLTWSGHQVDEDWAVVRAQARYALLNRLDRSDFGHAIRAHYRLVGFLPDDSRVHMLTGGGVVDVDQLWERLPSPGSQP